MAPAGVEAYVIPLSGQVAQPGDPSPGPNVVEAPAGSHCGAAVELDRRGDRDKKQSNRTRRGQGGKGRKHESHHRCFYFR